jgi:putative DNA primase/helicase
MGTNIHLVEEVETTITEQPSPAPRPASAFPHFPWTDAGNSELFAHLYGENVRFDHPRGQWFIFNGTIWVKDKDRRVWRLAKAAARVRLKNAATIDFDSEEVTGEYKWARSSESTTKIKYTLEQAKATKPISDTGEDWDANAYLFAAKNGVINLRNGRLRPGRPEDRITLQSPIEYDPSAKCPRWERFVDEIFASDRELISFMQRSIGYTLTGDTSEQCLFLNHGSGANGKSTLLNMISYIQGPHGMTLPFSSFESKRNPGDATNDIAALPGKRFVTCSEINESQALNEARIKRLTGGEDMSARLLFKEYFDFRPVAKFWLAFNHKPVVRDDSHGFWRRIHFIPFTVCFDGAKKDKHLEEALRREAPGILAWAVRGCLEWQRMGGLRPPTSVTVSTEEYRAENDIMGAFLDDRCVLGVDQWASSADLYSAYRNWADLRGDGAKLTQQAFTARLSKMGGVKGGERVGKDRTRGYGGVGLKPAAAEPESMY